MTRANSFIRSRDMDRLSGKTVKKSSGSVARVNIFQSCSIIGNLKIQQNETFQGVPSKKILHQIFKTILLYTFHMRTVSLQ